MTLSEQRGHSSTASLPALEQRIATLERELEAARLREASWNRKEEDLTDFVENAVMGLHRVGPDGTILWANAADWELLGYTAEEYVGHNIAEFHADQTVLFSILERLLDGTALRDQPAVLKCKDGSVRHVIISSNAHFENGRFMNTRCFTRDVTQQRLAEAALREARQHMAAIVESSVDAIVGLDLEGRINAWNRGAESIFGYAREEMVGRHITTIVPPELHNEEQEIIARVRSGKRVEHYETVRVAKHGARLDISLTVSPVRDSHGTIIGISKVSRDITARKAAQRELAEEARRKDEFLAILAHELRNPLAPIRYALSIAKQPNRSADQQHRAEEVIGRQVEHMARLLDDLLDVSRIARGHVELRKKWVDLTAIVGAAIDSTRPVIDQKQHTLTVDLPREPLRLEADPVRVTQILVNLLTNAAKYTDRGGQIQLRAWREGDMIAFAVRDNGIGIAPAMIPRLFTLFTQAKPALQRSEGGLGVGLALVKGFVEMHGGSVQARSEGNNQGSEFIVRLPVGAPQTDADAIEAGHAAQPSQRLRVLVADDNADAAQTCAMLMQMWGHDVRMAHDGAEAVTVAEAFKPDVAILDIGMPHLNGYQAAKQMRDAAWSRNLTLIAVTGWGQDDDKQRAMDAGFDHHLTKPVDPSVLQPVLEALGP
jgi:PAS domain S-box-containing protein